MQASRRLAVLHSAGAYSLEQMAFVLAELRKQA